MKNHVYLYIQGAFKEGAYMAKAKFRKRIIIDVSTEEHREIKARATKRYVSMRLYIMQAIEQQIIEERKYENDNVADLRRAAPRNEQPCGCTHDDSCNSA